MRCSRVPCAGRVRTEPGCGALPLRGRSALLRNRALVEVVRGANRLRAAELGNASRLVGESAAGCVLRIHHLAQSGLPSFKHPSLFEALCHLYAALPSLPAAGSCVAAAVVEDAATAAGALRAEEAHDGGVHAAARALNAALLRAARAQRNARMYGSTIHTPSETTAGKRESSTSRSNRLQPGHSESVRALSHRRYRTISRSTTF